MKKTIFALSILSVLFVSCKKDDPVPQISSANVASTMSVGNWGVTYYLDNNLDQTSKFAGYTFVFDVNGSVTATKTGSAVNGTWTTGNDDSQVKFILGFNAPADFVEISDDWHVIERTDSKVRLEDVSGGNGGTDYLTFERNK